MTLQLQINKSTETERVAPMSAPIRPGDSRRSVRRSLNWIVLLITVAVGVVGAAGLYFFHDYQLKRTADDLLGIIDSQEKREDWHAASQSLHRYLQLKPNDVEGRCRLALNFAKHANGESSQSLRRQAIDLHYRALSSGNPNHEMELRLSLMELLLEQQRNTEAEKEAHRVLDKQPDNPQAARGLAIALASLLADGSLANANTKDLRLVKSIELARKLNPADVRLANILSAIYREYPAVVLVEYPGLSERERNQRADENFDLLIQDNPQSAEAYLGRNAYRAKYKVGNANKDLETALHQAPEDPKVLLAAAVAAVDQARQIQLADGEVEKRSEQLLKAKMHYEKLVETGAQSLLEQAYLGLGDTNYLLGEFDQAVETWQKALQLFKQPTTMVALHARIAEAAIEQDQLSAALPAMDAIDVILSKLGGSVRREVKLNLNRGQDLRRASCYFEQQNYSAAMPLLRQIIISQPKGDTNVHATYRAWNYLGSIYSLNGEWLDAATAFDQASALDLDAPQPRLAAATAWLYAGRSDLASERAEQALQKSAVPEAWLALALAQLQVQSQLPVAQRSWLRLEKALSVLDRTKSRMRDGWRVSFLKAEYVMVKAKAVDDVNTGINDALAALRAAEEEYGSDKSFWSQLCSVYSSLKMDEESARCLGELRKIGATESEVVLVEARLASQRGEFARAQALLQEGLKSVPAHLQQRMQEELLLATLAARDFQRARGMLLDEHRQKPQNLAVVRRLAELDLEQRNLGSIREWESKLQAGGPLGEQQALYYRAWRLFLAASDEKAPQLQDALRDLEQLMLLRPNWADAAALKGMIEQRLGRKEQAVAAYERAIQLGVRRVHVFEQLITLLDALKRSAEVERYLNRLEADIPLSQRLAEMAMAHEIRRERPEQAIEVARSRVKQRPNDPVAQLWLSRLLVVTNKVQEAEGPLRRSTELAPADPRFWNALLDYYVRTKNREQVESLIERLALNAELEAVQKSLLIGRSHELLGNREQAEQNYTKAVDGAPNDLAIQLRMAQFFLQRSPQHAKKHLEAALKLDASSNVAKQMLAIVHAALGEMSEADALLSVASEDGIVAAEDVRLGALLLLQRGGEANLDMAVAKLEELIHRDSRAAAEQSTDRLLLARLYEQQARLSRKPELREARLKQAEQHLVGVAQQSDAAPAHVASLIQFLIRQDRQNEATAWLDRVEARLVTMPKEDANTIAMLIQLYLQHKSPARAEKWLVKLAEIDSALLRPTILKAQVAIALDSKANVEDFIEPKAASLEKAAKSDEERVQLLAAMGDLYFGLKKFAASERWYQRLLNADPTRYAPLVKAQQRQGRLRDAISVCEQATRVDATVQPFLLVAAALIEGKPTPADFEVSEPLLGRALKDFESDPRILYAVGLVRVMQKRDADSIVLFRKVVAASPRSVPALNNLAMLLADIPGERPAALKLIDQAIDFAGEDASLLDTKGAILLYSGRSAEALPLLELATRESAADPRHHFHLALAYRDQGKMEDAKRQLQTALERELVSQVLTNTDQQLLKELRTALKL